MARKTILLNAEIDVRHSRQPRTGAGGDTDISVIDLWTLILADPDTSETIEVTIGKGTRDAVVKALTGGVVLAGGELPDLGPHA